MKQILDRNAEDGKSSMSDNLESRIEELEANQTDLRTLVESKAGEKRALESERTTKSDIVEALTALEKRLVQFPYNPVGGNLTYLAEQVEPEIQLVKQGLLEITQTVKALVGRVEDLEERQKENHSLASESKGDKGGIAKRQKHD